MISRLSTCFTLTSAGCKLFSYTRKNNLTWEVLIIGEQIDPDCALVLFFFPAYETSQASMSCVVTAERELKSTSPASFRGAVQWYGFLSLLEGRVGAPRPTRTVNLFGLIKARRLLILVLLSSLNVQSDWTTTNIKLVTPPQAVDTGDTAHMCRQDIHFLLWQCFNCCCCCSVWLRSAWLSKSIFLVYPSCCSYWISNRLLCHQPAVHCYNQPWREVADVWTLKSDSLHPQTISDLKKISLIRLQSEHECIGRVVYLF